MRIVVTGKAGQVVRSLIERAPIHGDVELVTLGRPALNLVDPASVASAIAAARPDFVVSAAAYTAVDDAEDEPELAHAINATGAGHVARAAAAADAPVIHLSTDYVFDGSSDRPYRENDATGPLGVYAKSKLAGELEVAAANPRHVTLRTSGIYSPFGTNFVRTMLQLAAQREEIRVVADQWASPTSALDLADGILLVARRLHDDADAFPAGIYHLAGGGATNWSGLARHVFAASRDHGGPYATVVDIATTDYPTKARRPANSRLAIEKFAAISGWSPPDWRQSVADVVARLGGESARPPDTASVAPK